MSFFFTPSPERLVAVAAVAAGKAHARFWACRACGTWRAAPPWDLRRWWSPGMAGTNGCCCWKHAPADVVAVWDVVTRLPPPKFAAVADFPKEPVLW